MAVQGLFCFQIILLGVLTVFKSCDGFCFVGNLMAEMTVSRRLRYYCEYKSVDGANLRLLPGSNLYLADQCLECKCTMDGMHCCGFGHASGAIAIRKDCMMMLDGCQPLLVKTDNQSLDCFTGKPINITYLPHPDNMYASGNFAKHLQGQSSMETSSTQTTETASKPPITVTTQTANAPKTSSPSTTAPTTSSPSTTTQSRSSPSTSAPTRSSLSTTTQSRSSLSTATTTTSSPSTAAQITPASSTIAPATIAESPEEATTKTTATTPRPVVQSNIMAPSFAEFLRHLMTVVNSRPNLVSEPHFAPVWNTGSNAQFWNTGSNAQIWNTGINQQATSFPPVQYQQRSSNIWRNDYLFPWFLLL